MSGWLQKVRITQAPYRGVTGVLSFDRDGKAWVTYQDGGLQWIHVPADGTEEPLGDPYESNIAAAYTGEDEEEEDE